MSSVLKYIFLFVAFHKIPGTVSQSEAFWCGRNYSIPSYLLSTAFSSHADIPFSSPPSLPAVDLELKTAFLQLFQRLSSDDPIPKADNSSSIDPYILQQITSLCPYNALYFSLNPDHSKATDLLKDVFLSLPNATEVLRVAKEELTNHVINRHVWYTALLRTFLIRVDLIGYNLPFAFDATPDRFLPKPVIDSAYNHGKAGKKCPLYQGTMGATTTEENLLWYFREDVLYNDHHWNWHIAFPLFEQKYPERRGELFLHFHHQLVARYNAERLSNGVKMVANVDFRVGGSLGVGYNSELVDRTSDQPWTPRDADITLMDIDTPIFAFRVQVITDIIALLYSHIGKGILILPSNATLDILNTPGTDHLGNTVEAVRDLNVNPRLYYPNGIHNIGHVIISFSQDPDYDDQLPPGVMADFSVSARDPVFYRWHRLIDDLFRKHMDSFPPHQLKGDGPWPLVWDGVDVQRLEIATDGGTNLIQTFFTVTKIPLETGIDGAFHVDAEDSAINNGSKTDVCLRHLDHEPFNFTVTVDLCSPDGNQKEVTGTVRLFLAPRFDWDGRRFQMVETQKLMFQLDAFPATLKPGRNVIRRRSADSALTKPWPKSLAQMLTDSVTTGDKLDYCGCGYPQHLYVPKGSTDGMQFDLFVMITNAEEDKVVETEEDLKTPIPCKSPYLMCSIPNRKYPDARPMGYPFDTTPYSVPDEGTSGGLRVVEDLEEYVENVPNMLSTTITIQHLTTSNKK